MKKKTTNWRWVGATAVAIKECLYALIDKGNQACDILPSHRTEGVFKVTAYLVTGSHVAVSEQDVLSQSHAFYRT